MKKTIILNYLKLALGVLVIWTYFWMAHPVFIQYMPNFANYLNVVHKYNMDPTALYYNDVPMTKEAELNNRDAVRFASSKKNNFEKK